MAKRFKVKSLINENELSSDFQIELSNKFDEHINVRNYGAKGDGVTDDTDAIQNAIDSLSSGGIIFIPIGTYLVTGLTLPSFITIIGTGITTVLEYIGDGTTNLLESQDNPERITIKDLKLTGDGMYSGGNVSGIYIKPITAITGSYDTQHIIDNIVLDGFSGYGVYIGSSNRGCKLDRIYASYIGKTGFYIAGTDNMLSRSSAGQCGELGIYLNQNNRLYSCKPFLCGKIDGISPGIKIGNLNDIVNLDLQQNAYGGIEIAGFGNFVNFMSDGIGTGNTDVENDISVIIMTDTSSSKRHNTIIGSVASGQLDGHFNYILKCISDAQFNHIYITCTNYTSSKIPARDYTGTLSISNDFKVNGRQVIKSTNLLLDSNAFKPVCTGYTELSDINPYQNELEYSFPISMSEASLNGGCALRYTFDAGLVTIAQNYNRMELVAHIDSNIKVFDNIDFGFWVYENNVVLNGISLYEFKDTPSDVCSIFEISGASITSMKIAPMVIRRGDITDTDLVTLKCDEFRIRFFNE